MPAWPAADVGVMKRHHSEEMRGDKSCRIWPGAEGGFALRAIATQRPIPTVSSPSSTSESSPSVDQSRWFAEEVQPHEAALRSFLRRRVRSVSDVDDVVQDSYLKILKARPAGEIASIKAYLFTIARNTASKLFRKQKIFSSVPVSELPAWRVLDGKQNVAEAANAHLQDALIAEAIAELPGRCREILLLRVADGFSPGQIADRLRISQSTVRTQLARAMEKCTKLLRDRGVTSDL